MTLQITALVVLAGLAAARAAVGQKPGATPAGGLRATRPALEALLGDLSAAATAPDSSPAARARAGSQAAAVRTRLAVGDFQPGDRLALRVEGAEAPPQRTASAVARSVEQEVSDTFTVGSDRTIMLPVWGAVSLAGVLRSELEAHLTREIGRFVRYPVVHAWALVRVSVIGGVAHPGFYAMPADALLSDALTAAGGPIVDAKVHEMRIERAGVPLWTGAALQLALAEGRTLDEMNVRAGDRFVIPVRNRDGTYETVRTVGILLGIPLTIYSLTRIF